MRGYNKPNIGYVHVHAHCTCIHIHVYTYFFIKAIHEETQDY